MIRLLRNPFDYKVCSANRQSKEGILLSEKDGMERALLRGFKCRSSCIWWSFRECTWKRSSIMDVGVSHKGWHLWSVKHLKKRKAGEEDGIVAELLVYGIDVREDGEKSLVNVIQRLFPKCFKVEKFQNTGRMQLLFLYLRKGMLIYVIITEV